MTRPWGETTRRILALLNEIGPMTRSEVCQHLGLDRNEGAAIMSRLAQPTKRPVGPKRIYVAAWTYDTESQRRYPRAVYDVGCKPDAKKPKSDLKENKRRYLNARKLRVSSVFQLGLTRNQRRELGHGL